MFKHTSQIKVLRSNLDKNKTGICNRTFIHSALELPVSCKRKKIEFCMIPQ